MKVSVGRINSNTAQKHIAQNHLIKTPNDNDDVNRNAYIIDIDGSLNKANHSAATSSSGDINSNTHPACFCNAPGTKTESEPRKRNRRSQGRFETECRKFPKFTLPNLQGKPPSLDQIKSAKVAAIRCIKTAVGAIDH